MAVSIDEVRHAARLARMALSDMELEMLATDLSEVLDHFESVAQCASAELAPGDVEGRDVDTAAALRPDTVGAMLSTDEALRNAPESEKSQFSVPGFLPDEP